MEIKTFTTSVKDADICSISFEDGLKIECLQEVYRYGNELYLHIPEYQKYYDNGYTIKEFHEYRDTWAVRKNMLKLDDFDEKKTCVYRQAKNSGILDLLPHTVKYAEVSPYFEDGCIVENVNYSMYKQFRRDIKDILVAEDGNFVFAHLGTKKFNETVKKIEEDGFIKPIVMQPYDFNYFPLDSSIMLTVACILKVPSIPVKFLNRKASKDTEEKFIGNISDIMQANYDVDMRIDFSDLKSQKKASTYRFFILDNDKLIVNDDDHSEYIQKLCKSEIEEFVKLHGHQPTKADQYEMLEGKNYVRGYISNEYHEFGLDLMSTSNSITKDGLEILDELNRTVCAEYQIDKYLFDWTSGFKMSESYEEFRKSITSSKYYLPTWKSTQYT